jgi:hypothetical protein
MNCYPEFVILALSVVTKSHECYVYIGITENSSHDEYLELKSSTRLLLSHPRRLLEAKIVGQLD